MTWFTSKSRRRGAIVLIVNGVTIADYGDL